MLLDILTEEGDMLARKVSDNPLKVQYLLPTKYTDEGCVVYQWEEEVYEIQETSISGYYDTDDMTAAGFQQVSRGFVMTCDIDDDYDPSDISSSEDEIFSDVDSNDED